MESNGDNTTPHPPELIQPLRRFLSILLTLGDSPTFFFNLGITETYLLMSFLPAPVNYRRKDPFPDWECEDLGRSLSYKNYENAEKN